MPKWPHHLLSSTHRSAFASNFSITYRLLSLSTLLFSAQALLDPMLRTPAATPSDPDQIVGSKLQSIPRHPLPPQQNKYPTLSLAKMKNGKPSTQQSISALEIPPSIRQQNPLPTSCPTYPPTMKLLTNNNWKRTIIKNFPTLQLCSS